MFKEYRAHLLAKDRGQGTVDLYLRRLERFQRHFPDLTAVTLEDIEEHLAARRDLLAAETRKGLRTTLRSFYQWAYRRGLIEHDPTISLAPIRVHVAPPRVAPDDAVRRALAKATPAESAMVMLGRYACLRLAELTTLHTDQREGDLLRVVGKGQKVRMVPINDELLLALLRLERTQGPGYYFPSRGGAGPHLHTQSVSKIIRRLVGWNPHSLRHAGATAAYEATGDLRAVQMLLGHSSIATTQRYLNIGIDAVRRVAAATVLPQPPSGKNLAA